MAAWCLIAALLVLPTLFGSVQVEALHVDLSRRLQPPTLDHLFGTDELGRDLIARTLLGLSLSLRVVGAAVGIALTVAIALGSVAAAGRGHWPARIVHTMMALVLTVPFPLVVIALFAVVPFSPMKAALTIGLVAWAQPARLVEAIVRRLLQAPETKFLQALGYSRWGVWRRALLPEAAAAAGTSLGRFVPELITLEVGLSFFGLGVQPPFPSLGRLSYDGLLSVSRGWWLAVFPALGIIAVAILVMVILRTRTFEHGSAKLDLRTEAL